VWTVVPARSSTNTFWLQGSEDMTIISDTLRDPTGNGVGGVLVRATLVAASEVLAAGGAIIREAETTTATDGTWSLVLTPISQLSVSGGAYYLIAADGHRWAIGVPSAGGPYKLVDVEAAPAPLAPLGLTTATGVTLSIVDAKGDLLVGSGPDAVARLAVGTDTYVLTADSTAPNGVKWAVVSAGAASNGLPTGGTAGQLLRKSSGVDFAAAWVTGSGADVGLGNVNNTSDASKPISTATQAALNATQPLDSDLTAIAALTPTNDDVIQRKAGAWTNRTMAQLAADVQGQLTVAESQVTNLASDLAGKQPLDSDLTTIAGLTATTDNVIQSVAGAWASRTPAQLKATLALAKGDVGLGNVDNTSDATKFASTALTGTTTAVNVTLSGRHVVTPDALTDAATIATDASLGNHFRVTLGGNRTLGNPTNPVDGQKVMWELIQDATGSRTITLDTKFALGADITAVTLTTTASKRDFLGAVYNSTADKWYVIAFVKGY
jgi:hypothetical protein